MKNWENVLYPDQKKRVLNRPGPTSTAKYVARAQRKCNKSAKSLGKAKWKRHSTAHKNIYFIIYKIKQ